ncbi:MAG: hypothetical protein ACOCXQ_02565 [Patescibacteria group bacterium]
MNGANSKIIVMIAGVFLVVLLLVTVVISQLGGRSTDEESTTDSETATSTEPGSDRFTGSNPGNDPGRTDEQTMNQDGGDGGSNPDLVTDDSRPADDVIATVGQEKIYYIDLQYIADKYPNPEDADVEDILERLVEESVILQAADKDGLIDLSPRFYNSTNKDYLLRQRAINTIKDKINAQSSVIQGKVVSIWFANDVEPEIGLEEGKQFAKEKIDALHAQVVSGQLTIEQAGEMVRNDDSLEKIDIAHDVNALMRFERQQGEGITISEELDEALWQAEEGEVTDVFLVQATPTFLEEEIDALYMFGQVEEKKVNSRFPSYDSWLEKAKKEYDVTY